MNVLRFGKEGAKRILIRMAGAHETVSLEHEVKLIRELSGSDDFYMLVFAVDDWNLELSPWEAPPAFGKEGFGGQAPQSLTLVLDAIKTESAASRFYIGGYSLAGLFALWAACRTDVFAGVAAVSPSVWFPGFEEFIQKNDIGTKAVYLSLGDKEAKTKNALMSQVGDKIQRIHKALEGKVNITFEWNKGNHFREPDLRMAKGFAWLLK
ncbi:MAG: esterase [Lachnospiraceae bacterium]|nr:esterase [Lachnospiraceae bacterium]